MLERSRNSFLALLALPLVIVIVALIVIGALDVPKVISRPIVIVAIVLTTIELLRFVEALIRRHGHEASKRREDGDESSGQDIWEVIGNGFVALGPAGMTIYTLTCAACIAGFALSISVQTSADAARSLLFSQSEATLLAALSLTALVLEVRIAFIRHFGWPLD